MQRSTPVEKSVKWLIRECEEFYRLEYTFSNHKSIEQACNCDLKLEQIR
jgi:hypothetical protein